MWAGVVASWVHGKPRHSPVVEGSWDQCALDVAGGIAESQLQAVVPHRSSLTALLGTEGRQLLVVSGISCLPR